MWQAEVRQQRQSQVGTGGRSEKIKTYNYKVPFQGCIAGLWVRLQHTMIDFLKPG